LGGRLSFGSKRFLQETYLTKESEADNGNESEQECQAHFFVLYRLFSCFFTVGARASWRTRVSAGFHLDFSHIFVLMFIVANESENENKFSLVTSAATSSARGRLCLFLLYPIRLLGSA
jgi:hypothetical protein